MSVTPNQHDVDEISSDVDYSNAVAISREIFWVGFEEERTRLRCNPYVLIDAMGDDVILFDPGSIPDFPGVMRKVIDLVSLSDVSWVAISHQDPDVCGNLSIVEDVIDNPDLKIAAHLNTIRLIQHLGLCSTLYDTSANDDQIVLRSGRILDVIHLPFLHSPGAIAVYDRKSRSLFSGDLFGSISSGSLFDTSQFPSSMDAFHQAYMPSNEVVRMGLEKLEKLEIDRILPQHGNIIEDNHVQIAFDHLKSLPCGIDLVKS